MLFITKQEPQSKHLAKKAVTYKASRITKIKAKTSKVTIQKGKTTKLQTRVYISKKLKKGYLDPEILKFTTSNKKGSESILKRNDQRLEERKSNGHSKTSYNRKDI